MLPKRVTDVVARQSVISSWEEKMRLRTVEKEGVYHPFDAS